MPFLACTAGFAQNDATVAAPQNGEVTYWVDSTSQARDKRILNKSKFWDNWFVGIQAGVQADWGSNTFAGDNLGKIRPSGAISVGKWLAPFGGFRIQGYLGSNTGHAYNNRSYHYYNAGAGLDALFGLTNLFCGYKENRKFNLVGFLGIGYERTFGFSDRSWNTADYAEDGRGYLDNRNDFVSVRLGLIAMFRLNDRLDFTIEGNNSVIDDAFDGRWKAPYSKRHWDGHANLLVGLNYRFLNHDGTRHFTYATRDMSKYQSLNDEINRLRAENQRLAQEQKTVTYETEYVNQNRLNTYISFANNSSTINKLQEVNVYTAAEGLKKYSDGDLYIVPNGQAKDSDLFVARAQSVRSVLINTYNIPAGRIFIEKNPAVVQSLDPQKSCVIVYVNE